MATCTKRAFGRVFCFYADAYRIYGQSITADHIGSLYEALPSTRLSELWLEQHMFSDHLAFRCRSAYGRHGIPPQFRRQLFFGRHVGLGLTRVRLSARRWPGLSSLHPLRPRGVQAE